MKKIVFLIVLFFLCLRMASAQDETLFPKEKVMHLTNPRSANKWKALSLKTGPGCSTHPGTPNGLPQPSNGTSFQREFFQYNSSFQRTQDLILAWNPTLGVWQNSTRYITLFTGSGGLASMSGQTWYPAGSNWVTTSYTHFNDTGRTDTSFSKNYDPNTNEFAGGSMSLNYTIPRE